MAKSQLHDLARLGAQAKLDALDREREEILGMFPDLRGGRSASAGAKGQKRQAPAQRRGSMSEEARRAQSARMTAYWAARRAAKAAAGEGGNGNGAAETTRAPKRGRKGRRKK